VPPTTCIIELSKITNSSKLTLSSLMRMTASGRPIGEMNFRSLLKAANWIAGYGKFG
jgi:hypothetical protein